MRYCNDWSEACGSKCSIYLLDRGRIKQAIVSRQKQESEAGQRRKQFQAGVGVTSTGSEYQGSPGSNTEIRIRRMGKRSESQPGQEQDFAKSRRKSRAYVVCGCV